MIEPLLSDDAFLADVNAAGADPNTLHLWWLGQSGFLLGWSGNFILIDPYLSESLTLKYANTGKPHVRMSRRVIDPRLLDFVALVTSSHNHTDHLDPDTLRPLLSVQKKFGGMIAPAANLVEVRTRSGIDAEIYLRGLDDGQSISTCRTRITGIASAHETIERDELGRCKFLGYVFQFGGWSVYHSGDTVLYDGLVHRLFPFQVDVAAPANQRSVSRAARRRNLSGSEAAWLAHQIGAKLVIPCHYDMFEFNTASPDEFVSECKRLGQPYKVLQLGGRLVLDGKQGRELFNSVDKKQGRELFSSHPSPS